MRRNMILAVWFIIIFASAFGSACGKSAGASPIRNKLLEMTVLPSVRTSNGASPYVEWKNGPPRDAGFFPIAVWLQNPGKARRYEAAGFNTYVGLWKGPTEQQLAELKKAGMKVICHQNEVGRKYIDDEIIIGWMHGDEPDNAQPLGQGKGYGPPIPPKNIIDDYRKIHSADPTRPVLLNLGQGVAWDYWHGRGVRTNHPEDYPEYVKGCDIASFDIYPVAHPKPQVSGKLWYVARGVERLVKWTEGEKIVWNCIECTRIKNPTNKATPHQVRCEVWMSIIHGSMGLIYFVHEWEPKFNESALLSDPAMLSAVTAINRQIIRLAPVLNSATIKDGASVSSDNKDVPVAVMMKRHNRHFACPSASCPPPRLASGDAGAGEANRGASQNRSSGGATYLFAVGMSGSLPDRTTATFTVPGLAGERAVEVLGEPSPSKASPSEGRAENRTILSKNGVFKDNFGPWDVHLYRIRQANPD